MLSNAYFLAKFRFDTAENKPAKNLQNFANFANPNPNPNPNPDSLKKNPLAGQRPARADAGADAPRGARRAGGRPAESCDVKRLSLKA